MITCSNCGGKADYLIKEKNIFLCDKCRSISKDKLFSKLVNKNLSNQEINFLKAGHNFLTFYNFKYLESFTFDIIKAINNLSTKNIFNILIFPNKKESTIFLERFFKKSSEGDPESRYTLILQEEENYILLNYDRLKINELTFLINYSDYQVSFKPTEAVYDSFMKSYGEILFSYNKKIGINFVKLIEEEKEMVGRFGEIFIMLVSSYLSLKNLKIKYPELTLDHIINHINLFGRKKINHSMDNLPHFYSFIDLVTVYTEWSALKSIDKKYEDIINKTIKNVLTEIEWGDYSLLKESLTNYMDNLCTRLQKCKNEEVPIIIQEEIKKLINDVPPIILRLGELLCLSQESEEISTLLQVAGPNPALYSHKVLSFLIKTKPILNKVLNPTMKYILYESRWFILQQYSIINQDKKMFKLAYDEMIESINYLKINFNLINRNLQRFRGVKLLTDDILLRYNGLGYLCYCMGEIEKFNKIRKQIKEILKVKKISNFTKIMVYSQDFFFDEDYDSLKLIYRMYKNYTPDLPRVKSNSVKSMGSFSEAFFTEDIKTKNEYYSEAISLNESEEVNISSLQKDLSQITVTGNLFKMFYSLENAFIQDTPFFMIAEIDNALNYSRENISHAKEFETSYYYFYKTSILHSLLKGDLPSVKKYLNDIKRYNSKQSLYFQNNIEETLNILNKTIKEKLFYLNSLKETPDIWIKLIRKYIKESINRDFYKEFSETKSEITKTKDMLELMNKFRSLVLDKAVTSFWKKGKMKLNSNAEDIGRNLLLVFLGTLNTYELNKESIVNFYKMDIIALDKGDTKNSFIFETKIYRDSSNYEKGIKQIEQKYYHHKKYDYKNLKPFYIVFDPRKKPKEIKNDIYFGEKDKIKLEVIQIPINKLF